MSARRRILQRVFLLYLAAMLAVVLLPIGGLIDTVVNAIHAVGQGLGVPDVLTPRRWEFLLNVVLFAIPTALAVLLWPRVERWVWLAVAFGGSVLVELVQYLALPRVAIDDGELPALPDGDADAGLVGFPCGDGAARAEGQAVRVGIGIQFARQRGLEPRLRRTRRGGQRWQQRND